MTLRDVRSGLQDLQAWANDPRPRIGLGLDFFDRYTNGGLAKSEVAMFLAYSSVGKTSLGLNMIARNKRVPTVVFSLEMSWRMLISRITAIETGVPTWELEELLKQGQPPQATQVAVEFPLLLGDDASEMSLKDMKVRIAEASEKLGTPIRLVIIDYLELIGGNGMLGKSEAVDRVAQKIRALAKDCDCSVVVLHQVSMGDGSDGHLPLNLGAGKFGGHQPMDYVVGAYAPRLNRKLSQIERKGVEAELYLQLLKNRSGKARPEGVRHFLDPITGRLSEWGQQHTAWTPAPFQPQMVASDGVVVASVPTPEFVRDVAVPPPWLVDGPLQVVDGPTRSTTVSVNRFIDEEPF